MSTEPPADARAARSSPNGNRRSLLVHTAITAAVTASFLLVLVVWADSYLSCRRISWGDRYRGSYTFIHSSCGGLFLERRTNSDVSARFTCFRRPVSDYRLRGPDVRYSGFVGFEHYEGTRYCWYEHLYPLASLPSYDDPRWQKEPYKMVRVPYWPLGILLIVLVTRLLRRNLLVWGLYRRARRGLCLRCGYNLTGNMSGVCPECGTAVSRESQKGRKSESRQGMSWIGRAAIAIFCGLVFVDLSWTFVRTHEQTTVRAMEYVISVLGGTGPNLGWQVLAAHTAVFILLPAVVVALSFCCLTWWFKPRQPKAEPR